MHLNSCCNKYRVFFYTDTQKNMIVTKIQIASNRIQNITTNNSKYDRLLHWLRKCSAENIQDAYIQMCTDQLDVQPVTWCSKVRSTKVRFTRIIHHVTEKFWIFRKGWNGDSNGIASTLISSLGRKNIRLRTELHGCLSALVVWWPTVTTAL